MKAQMYEDILSEPFLTTLSGRMDIHSASEWFTWTSQPRSAYQRIQLTGIPR